MILRLQITFILLGVGQFPHSWIVPAGHTCALHRTAKQRKSWHFSLLPRTFFYRLSKAGFSNKCFVFFLSTLFWKRIGNCTHPSTHGRSTVIEKHSHWQFQKHSATGGCSVGSDGCWGVTVGILKNCPTEFTLWFGLTFLRVMYNKTLTFLSRNVISHQ